MYFAISRLEKWLRERKYLHAYKIHYLATETQDRESYRKQTTSDTNGRTFVLEDRFIEMTTSSNMETTMVPITRQTNAFYAQMQSMVKAVKSTVGAALAGQGTMEPCDMAGGERRIS